MAAIAAIEREVAHSIFIPWMYEFSLVISEGDIIARNEPFSYRQYGYFANNDMMCGGTLSA